MNQSNGAWKVLTQNDRNPFIEIAASVCSRLSSINAARVAFFVAARTIRFRKLIERIPSRHFLNGVSGVSLPAVPNRHRLCVAKQLLSNDGLLAEFDDQYYGLVLPTILVRALSVDSTIVSADLIDRTVREYESSDYFRDLIPEEIMRKLKTRAARDVAADLADISKVGHLKNAARGLRPTSAIDCIDQLISLHWPCESVKHVDVGPEGKRSRCISNFRRYCERSGMVPETVISDVIKNWPLIVIGCRGPTVLLDESRFSFLEFFRHREVILASLDNITRSREDRKRSGNTALKFEALDEVDDGEEFRYAD